MQEAPRVLGPRLVRAAPAAICRRKKSNLQAEDVRVSLGVLLWPACDNSESCDRRSRRRVSARRIARGETRGLSRALARTRPDGAAHLPEGEGTRESEAYGDDENIPCSDKDGDVNDPRQKYARASASSSTAFPRDVSRRDAVASRLVSP